MKKQKGFIVPLLLTIIAILVIGGGVYIYQNSKPQTITTQNQSGENTNTSDIYQNATPTPITQNADTNAKIQSKPDCPNGVCDVSKSKELGGKTYVNNTFSFSYKYPETWVMQPSKKPDFNVDFLSPSGQHIEVLTAKVSDTSEAGNPTCDTVKPYGYEVYRSETATISHYKVKYYQELIPANHGYSTIESDLCVYQNPQTLFKVSIINDPSIKDVYTEAQEKSILDYIYSSISFTQ